MLHIVKLIERKFPDHADSIVRGLVTLSLLALIAGGLIAIS